MGDAYEQTAFEFRPTPAPPPTPAPTPTPAPEGPINVAGPVTLNWDRPDSRENGDYLAVNEIGGFELRYRAEGDSDFTYVLVEDGYATSQYIGDFYGVYEFQVAVYDTNGLYSQFVPARTNL